jgi:hypothetical protein
MVQPLRAYMHPSVLTNIRWRRGLNRLTAIGYRSSRGMANGSLGLLDSLVFDGDTPAELAMAMQRLRGGHHYVGPEIEIEAPYGVIIRISGTACVNCETKQSIFARPVAEGVRVARVVRPACWCADCAKDEHGAVRVGAPRWHSIELPDVLSRMKAPIVEGEGLVVVTIDGPKLNRSKPTEVKLQR